MDPDETLARLRRFTDEVIDADSTDVRLVDFAEHFRALDNWISKGGYRPADWSI